MSELSISTDEGFGENGIFMRRIISIDGKMAETPAGSIPIDRLAEDTTVNPRSRGINEIHVHVDSEKIQKEINADNGPISRYIESALENAQDDEITIVFTTFDEVTEYESEIDDEVIKDPYLFSPGVDKKRISPLPKITSSLAWPSA